MTVRNGSNTETNQRKVCHRDTSLITKRPELQAEAKAFKETQALQRSQILRTQGNWLTETGYALYLTECID